MTNNLAGKKIAILATDGFEQAELMEPRRALDEAGATTHIVRGLQFGIAMTHAQYFIDICTRSAATSLPVAINPMPSGTKVLGAGVAVRHPAGVVSARTESAAGARVAAVSDSPIPDRSVAAG